MAMRPKRPRDPMLLANLIGDIATGQVENVKPTPPDEARRRGGLKGGKVRARKLSAKQRTAIATKAAAELWRRQKGTRRSQGK